MGPLKVRTTETPRFSCSQIRRPTAGPRCASGGRLTRGGVPRAQTTSNAVRLDPNGAQVPELCGALGVGLRRRCRKTPYTAPSDLELVRGRERRPCWPHSTPSSPHSPIPILAVPYTAFSGNAAGGPHQAQRRAPAPEPRWGRAVQRWLRFAVAEGPRGSLLQRYAILAPPSPVDFAHN